MECKNATLVGTPYTNPNQTSHEVLVPMVHLACICIYGILQSQHTRCIVTRHIQLHFLAMWILDLFKLHWMYA